MRTNAINNGNNGNNGEKMEGKVMRKLLRLDYDLNRTAPDRYQEGAEVGLRTEEVKHCTAYLPVISTATLAWFGVDVGEKPKYNYTVTSPTTP